MNFRTTRPRRLRNNENLRALVRETELNIHDFVLPLFIRHGDESKDIASMPGHRQLCLADLSNEIQTLKKLNLRYVILFGIPEHKDAKGSSSYDNHGIIQQAIKMIKNTWPECFVIADVCLCEYTDHTHCGVLNQDNDVDNDLTLPLLAKQAVSFAKAGADMVAPSGMIDGMVHAIRTALDDANFQHLPIMSYSVKYASAYYGPFRDAADSQLKFGDRKTYQMDPSNTHEAVREAALDIKEGADILMVKPAGPYLDVLYRVTQTFPEIPCAAYQVSGEFSMIKAAAAAGLIDEKTAALESLIAIKRAGARFIITYFAKQAAEWISTNI